MLGEIYWDEYPATQVKVTFRDSDVVVLCEGKDSEYRSTFSGRIILALTLEEQVVQGTIQYKYENGTEETTEYKLVGAFEDDSFELFEGDWIEHDEHFQFDALLERPVLEKMTETESGEPNSIEASLFKQDRDDSVEVASSADFNKQYERDVQGTIKKPHLNRHGANRQRATRSDARVRTIQRKIELYYDLPQGSVRLVNPDRSIIHPSAKIRTLRERWMFD
ncbi:hypothetical protein U4959_11935 [Acinetobacter junii]|jgi:hypothetical protein|uniref:hypothetical protein n=1 Tax=Acinetobacter junii TaxID=40215 RepID=UPI0009507C80|nr:hypothetical protein [Acinetobacter junii]APU48063.1 hypothetical protein BVL33_05895 [Acinetobacter junii]MCU4408677.1 hypothetical protein [Acinetobacter junii]MDH0666927.1 hypothetical protein [Acinetobacter junii]MDH1691467.1 hypothetical protein [Acinetobacter junii]MDU2408960.1 hypothetical protein [Acinetobacter junii]